MKEMYSNEPNLLIHAINVRGVPTRPEDDSLTAKLYVSNDGEFGASIPLTTRVIDNGKCEIPIQQNDIQDKRFAKVVVEYDLTDRGHFKDSYNYEIAKRLVTFDQVNDALGPNYAIEYDIYTEVEANVRMIIEAYCNQTFTSWTGTRKVRGQEGLVYLPQHMSKLNSVEVRTNLMGVDVVSGHGGYELEDNGYAIFNEDKIRTISIFHDKPADNTSMNVYGSWGFETLPVAITQAAIELVRVFLCDDIEYRRRFIDNIRSGDMRLQFSPEAYVDSTGNKIADDMLQPHRVFNVGAV